MIRIGEAKKVVTVIKHINPPWGEGKTKFSAHFKGVIGRGTTADDAIVHLLYLINQNAELTEDLADVITKASR